MREDGKSARTESTMLKNLGADLSALEKLGYHGIEEKIYTSDHPEVLEWTSFFCERFQSKQIFEKFEEAAGGKSLAKAIAVGTQWYRFSAYVPWLLCRAASQVSTNRIRHYVIQTAFEELGMRKESEIHPEMFQATTFEMGVTRDDHIRLSAVPATSAALRLLQKTLLKAKSDGSVLGLLLGLECPARENIETVFSSLAHTAELEPKLAQTLFFRFHRTLEIEHIRLTVSNFLRFCATEKEKKDFIRSFDAGIEFWAKFWRGVGALSSAEQRRLAR